MLNKLLCEQIEEWIEKQRVTVQNLVSNANKIVDWNKLGQVSISENRWLRNVQGLQNKIWTATFEITSIVKEWLSNWLWTILFDNLRQ